MLNLDRTTRCPWYNRNAFKIPHNLNGIWHYSGRSASREHISQAARSILVDWSFIAIIIQLIFLEGILSIDNAAILGAMVSVLPEHEPIPWPKRLQKIGHILDKPLGHQRGAALRVGLIGAYVGRGLMLLAASYIIQNPWLMLIGAAYLLRFAL